MNCFGDIQVLIGVDWFCDIDYSWSLDIKVTMYGLFLNIASQQIDKKVCETKAPKSGFRGRLV